MNYPKLSNAFLCEIANTYGTPLYVYNASTIRQQYQKLSTAFAPFAHRIHYATKALTNINIIHLLSNMGACIDCVSINEVMSALHTGVSPDRILYTANLLSKDNLKKAVDLGVNIHIDTLGALRLFGAYFGDSKPIGIRINPELNPSGGTLNISTAHIDSKFGIAVSYIDEIVEVVKKFNIQVIGLHQHTGSDVKDASMLIKGLEVLDSISHHFPNLVYLDIGGGFKVPYYENDIAIDIDEIASRIQSIVKTMKSPEGKPYTIWFELGKYLVSQAGYLLTQVNEIKKTPTKNFIGVNTGFHHLIRPMFYDAYHYIDNLSSQSDKKCQYDVVGILCETDNLATDRLLPLTQKGDILAIHNAGAYSFEMASNFNSQLRPAEVLIQEDGSHQLIRRRENFEDLLNKQIQLF